MSNLRISRGTGQRRPTPRLNACRLSRRIRRSCPDPGRGRAGQAATRERLLPALGRPTENELPGALRCAFGELQAAMTRIVPVGNETRVRASVQKMSPADASGHAFTIVKLYLGSRAPRAGRAAEGGVAAPPKAPALPDRPPVRTSPSAAVHATAIKVIAPVDGIIVRGICARRLDILLAAHRSLGSFRPAASRRSRSS